MDKEEIENRIESLDNTHFLRLKIGDASSNITNLIIYSLATVSALFCLLFLSLYKIYFTPLLMLSLMCSTFLCVFFYIIFWYYFFRDMGERNEFLLKYGRDY